MRETSYFHNYLNRPSSTCSIENWKTSPKIGTTNDWRIPWIYLTCFIECTIRKSILYTNQERQKHIQNWDVLHLGTSTHVWAATVTRVSFHFDNPGTAHYTIYWETQRHKTLTCENPGHRLHLVVETLNVIVDIRKTILNTIIIGDEDIVTTKQHRSFC